MALKTKESLQRMFQESRERQQKKKEQQSKLKLEARKEKYKEIDQILKKSLQEEKKQIMDNLQALLKKRSQNVRKCPSWMLEQYQDTWQLWETNESDLYQTREELQQYELENGGKVGSFINWDVWDKLIKEGNESPTK